MCVCRVAWVLLHCHWPMRTAVAAFVSKIAWSACCILTPWPVQLFWEPIHWDEIAHCLGMVLNKQLTWLTHIDHVRKTAAQRLVMLGRLLNRRSDLFIRNGVLLYKQLIHPMMDYACPIWRSAADICVRKLHVLQSKCLRIAAISPWYIGYRQIHEDLGVAFFANYIKAVTERFSSNLAE